VETLKFWARPAVIAALWIAATSFTLSELTTVVPSLRSASPPSGRSREAMQHVVRARVQSISRAAIAP
jgi:hypothetical protein